MKKLDAKYIDGDIQRGVLYDWKIISKEFKKLNIPKDVYNPLHIPFDKANINVILSERSTGKTTNLLLLGMLINRMYSHRPRISYMVDTSAHAQPKKISRIFDTIISCGYVQKLTEGAYNSIYVYGGKCRFCNVDESGKMTEKEEKHFMDILVVADHENYKSVFTSNSDFIIFDEFIKEWYPKDEFIELMDLISTIKRDRISTKLFLLSNLIQRNNPYFDELEVRTEINRMEIGDKKIVTTDRGTPIFLEIVGSEIKAQTPLRILSNKLYYGFKNPALTAITGGGWAVNSYPHIPRDCGRITKVDNTIRVKMGEEILQIEVVVSDKIGFMGLVHKSSNVYPDSVIYTDKPPQAVNEIYGFGYTNYDKFVWGLYTKNRFYYATNQDGNTLNSFIRNIKQR